MKIKLKATRGKQKAAAIQLTTTVWRFGRSRVAMHLPQSRALTQIAKVICGNAFVSVHLRPVSTHSHCSFGHSSQVHGTSAQIKLATSPYLYVVCNVCAKDRKRKIQFAPKTALPFLGSAEETEKELYANNQKVLI
ncbi:MAG: hypothetical protein JNL74_02195 [Fibrobacteres bacterium]|nr:hypothetical protein [Fibrobacterota bacterium]